MISRSLSEIFEKTIATLKRHNMSVEIIGYPREPRARSIDLLARDSEGERRIFVKVAEDASELPSSEIKELRRLGAVLDVSTVIVAEKDGEQELEDFVAYEKQGLALISPEGLHMALSNSIYVIKKRGNYYMKLDGAKLRKFREEKGYSLGELAAIIGISRRSVYEYERGTMDVSLQTALRILEVAGEEVFEPIDVLSEAQKHNRVGRGEMVHKLDTEEEKMVVERMVKMGCDVVHARHTAVDLAVRTQNERAVIVIEHGERDRDLLLRSEEAVKLGSYSDSKLVALLTRRGQRDKDVESMGFEVYTRPEELLEALIPRK